MPEIDVKIEWDDPKQEHWLDVRTIELVLSTYYPNTNFKVIKLGDDNNG